MLEFGDVYQEMENFVYWLANQKAEADILLMSTDELIGELFEEMWKVFQHYRDDVTDMKEMKKLLKASFDNRVSELLYRYAVTHRKHKLSAASLDADYDKDEADAVVEGSISINIGAAVTCDVDDLVLSRLRVDETRARLDAKGQRVLDAVISGHPMLEAHIRLSGTRAKEVYSGRGTIKVKTWHVANALAMNEQEVRGAFRQIRDVYEEVCREYGS